MQVTHATCAHLQTGIHLYERAHEVAMLSKPPEKSTVINAAVRHGILSAASNV